MTEPKCLYIKVPTSKDVMLSDVLFFLAAVQHPVCGYQAVRSCMLLKVWGNSVGERADRFSACRTQLPWAVLGSAFSLQWVCSTENKGCIAYQMNLISPFDIPPKLTQLFQGNKLILSLTFKWELLVKVPPVEMSTDVNAGMN